MSRRLRDLDPETWVEDREADRRLDDESDRRGTRAERALEAHVHGEDYRDRYDTEQVAKTRPVAEAPRTMPLDVAWTVRDGQQMYVAACGCTWRITQTPLSLCATHRTQDGAAEDRAEQRHDGAPVTSTDWDAWEAGAGWHPYPGQAGW